LNKQLAPNRVAFYSQQKPVQEKNCTRKQHVTRASFFCRSTCASLLYTFLERMSARVGLGCCISRNRWWLL